MALRRRGAHRRSIRSKVDATVPWDEPERPSPPPTSGPWDVADAPDEGVDWVDLGAMRIPIVKGIDVRVEVNREGKVAAATLSHQSGQMQVGVFAAPRSEGIWDEVRGELLGSISSQGGTAQEVRGRFGMEISGQVAVQGGRQPARFIGVDGPRWFLRALLTGPAATDPAQAAALEDALAKVVVSRGSEPMPVREPLTLQLPPDLAEQAARQQEAQASQGSATKAGGSKAGGSRQDVRRPRPQPR